jgi:predicted dehydrogenase
VSSEPTAVIRLGLIGAGRWGKNFIRTIRGLDGVVLSVLCSRNPASGELVDSNCKIVHDWHDLLGSDLCDGLIIATPPDTHAEILAAMIRARMPSMVEKPLTLDLQEALDLQRLLQQTTTPVLVDHIYLFHPAYRELKRLLAELGPIRSIQSEGGNHGPFRPNYNALWDYGPHDIAMCLDLIQTLPLHVACKASETSEGGNYELDLQFPSDVRASIKVGNLVSTKVRRLTVQCENNILVFDDLSTHKLQLDGAPIPVADTPPLAVAIKLFANGMRHGATEYFGLDLAVEVTRVLDAAQASSRHLRDDERNSG